MESGRISVGSSFELSLEDKQESKVGREISQ
jgi:hypothetical protein